MLVIRSIPFRPSVNDHQQLPRSSHFSLSSSSIFQQEVKHQASDIMFQPEGANPICVFCASSPGKLPVYTAAAESVGKALAESGRPLVYGGGVRGLMGGSWDSAGLPVSNVLLNRNLLYQNPLVTRFDDRDRADLSNFSTTAGVVSSATLKAGGRSHGIIPRALTGRAAEIAVDAARADPSAPSTPITEGSPDRGVESKEGRGEQLIRTEDNYEGRFTTETVKTMHEVSPATSPPRGWVRPIGAALRARLDLPCEMNMF